LEEVVLSGKELAEVLDVTYWHCGVCARTVPQTSKMPAARKRSREMKDLGEGLLQLFIRSRI
jgi:hypothetical protein